MVKKSQNIRRSQYCGYFGFFSPYLDSCDINFEGRWNPKKCELFCMELHFLGHKISQHGIEADKGKADHILAWLHPKSAQEVCSFLGLVRYLATFLPNLADHTAVLTELTLKSCESVFPLWTAKH